MGNQMSKMESPAEWICNLGRPDWDAYFMAMVFLVATRSPDQETKVGCVIVDWDTKLVLGTGYNGHPRNAGVVAVGHDRRWSISEAAAPAHEAQGCKIERLPTSRPDKYPFMIHADINALTNCHGKSSNAVVYLPMPPCEVCLRSLANHPSIHVKRIVFLEYRVYPNTERLLEHLPEIRCEQYKGPHPAEWLMNAAKYATLRTEHGAALSVGSTTSYSKQTHGG